MVYNGSTIVYLKFNPLSAKKSKVKVTLCQRAHRLPALPPTFKFHPLVVSFSEMQERVYM